MNPATMANPVQGTVHTVKSGRRQELLQAAVVHDLSPNLVIDRRGIEPVRPESGDQLFPFIYRLARAIKFAAGVRFKLAEGGDLVGRAAAAHHRKDMEGFSLAREYL